jgi:hypothetical protein
MNFNILKLHTNVVFRKDLKRFIEIMNEYEEHKRNIDLIHSIYNNKIRTLKDMINPSKAIVEMNANEKKLKDETIKA